MKVLLLFGSPKKNGSSARLLNEVLNGLKAGNDDPVEVKNIYLNDVEIKSCQGCLACLKTGICSIKDDMGTIYDDIQDSDLILLSTPVYFNGVSSQVKLFIDRNKAFFGIRDREDPEFKKYPFYSRVKPGKFGASLITCALPNDDMLRLTKETVNGFFKILGVNNLGSHCQTGMKFPKQIDENPSITENAFSFGQSLVDEIYVKARSI
jgi:hypothetical protein